MNMIWLITLTLFWIIGGIFYISLFVVSKRADEWAEAIFTREIIKPHELGAFYNTSEVLGKDESKICLSQ